MDYFNGIITTLILGMLSVLILIQFLPRKSKGRNKIIQRLPLLVFSVYYFLYWVWGSIYFLSDKKYFIFNAAADAVPYALLVVILSYISFVVAFYLFRPQRTAEPVRTGLPLSYKAAVITCYALLWVLRLYLMKLGLYHKYAFVENLINVSLPPLVNIFYQIMYFSPFLFIMVSIVYFRTMPWLIPMLEIINFVFLGGKSAIIFALAFGFLISFIYGRFTFRDMLQKKKHIITVLLVIPLFYASFYITPYVYSRNLLISKNYLWEMIRNIPDFINYVTTSGESEATDQQYMHTRLAAIDPLSAITYRIKFEDRELLKGQSLIDAVEAIVPRVLYPNKPERFGYSGDIEKQDALKHYDLPYGTDVDTVSTIIFSGYANFGLLGSLSGMFLFGAFVAFSWKMILNMTASKKSFLQFNGFLIMVFFLTRVLLLEQTLIPAVLLNVRNIAFTLLVFIIVRFFYYLLFIEFMRRTNIRSESL